MNIVLVASRSRELLTSLREMLGEGYELYFAKHLSEVLAALAQRPTDLVFVDTRLGDCDGKDIIKEIAVVFPETACVYLAPEEQGKPSAIGEEEGAYACLRGPLNRGLVRFLAEKAIEKRKLARKIEYLASLAEGTPEKEDSQRRGDWVPAEYRGGASGFLSKGMVRKLLKSVSPITDLNKLLGMFGDSVRELFGSNNVAIFTWDTQKGRYAPGAWQGVDEGLAVVCTFSTRHGMVRWLIEHQQLLTRDKLRTAFPHDVAVEVRTDMDALRAEVILPLLERGSLIGFLSLGRKMTGRKYEEEDLELLAVIGDCASGAIGTALLHRELSSQKARTDSIFRNISCGIVAVDTEGRIAALNHFAEGAFEVSSAELIGKSIQKLGSVLSDMVFRTIKDDDVFVNRPYRDGATGRIFAVSTCRLLDEASNVHGAILFFTALPEVAAPAAVETGTLDGEVFAAFCANIADKIKNPLSSIKTFSQLLPEKFDDTEFREKFSEVVGRAVERINSLAEGLTAYAATGPLDLSATNLGAVVENTVASLQRNFSHRNLRVVAPEAEKPAMVLADGRLIRSAFLNVLKNSIESTPPDGTITISIKEMAAKQLREEKGGKVVFDGTGISSGDGGVLDDEVFVQTEFRDTGKGIPEDAMARIGEPFFTTKGENVGLGLAVAGKIVSKHRGRMEIQSEEGKGTTIRILLPRGQNAR